MSEPTRQVPSVSPSPEPQSAVRALPPWIAPAALAIAVIGVAIALWALLRPAPETVAAPDSSELTSQEAKARACAAYTTANKAVSLQTHGDIGPDPAAVQAVAANARLAMSEGASYMLEHLDPATPPEIAAAVRSFSVGLQDISINALGGVTNDDPAQAARMREAETASAQVAQLCK